jgi:hypothetical protein
VPNLPSFEAGLRGCKRVIAERVQSRLFCHEAEEGHGEEEWGTDLAAGTFTLFMSFMVKNTRLDFLLIIAASR